MKKIRTIVLSFALLAGVVAAPLAPATAFAQTDPAKSIGDGVKEIGGGEADSKGLTDMIKTIVNVLLFILGAVAVVMIIFGGIKYTTSNGNSSQVSSAKDTILYSVVGLVVAILAYAIVNFVISSFSK
jgi:drug/metabolite transporter (DMT)-like permease